MLVPRSLAVAAFMIGGAQASFAQVPTLGPKDGAGLPPTDLGRVVVGGLAPDFTLEAFARAPVTLSDFRGKKNVVLVFYRGHW